MGDMPTEHLRGRTARAVVAGGAAKADVRGESEERERVGWKAFAVLPLGEIFGAIRIVQARLNRAVFCTVRWTRASLTLPSEFREPRSRAHSISVHPNGASALYSRIFSGSVPGGVISSMKPSIVPILPSGAVPNFSEPIVIFTRSICA